MKAIARRGIQESSFRPGEHRLSSTYLGGVGLVFSVRSSRVTGFHAA